MKARNGTDLDAAAAMKTFSEMGYKVQFANDQTVTEMKTLLCNGNRNYSVSFIPNYHCVK